ncbi:Uncharacterised protein [uncultured archaeon]|nr:Uncharacterised protein [uncultured archaeon]
MNPLLRCFIQLNNTRKGDKTGSEFITSVNASYTLVEASNLLMESGLRSWKAEQTAFHIIITGRKEYSSQEKDMPIMMRAAY